MQCPGCGKSTVVLKTTMRDDCVYRRRICRECNDKFSTYERVSSETLSVREADLVEAYRTLSPESRKILWGQVRLLDQHN